MSRQNVGRDGVTEINARTSGTDILPAESESVQTSKSFHTQPIMH